jgi:hypothetical protein
MDDSEEAVIRRAAQKMLELGWRPSIDEPGRIYPMEADMPSALTSRDIWWAMHEIQAESKK